MTYEDYLMESFKSSKAEPRITASIPPLYKHFLKFWYCKDKTPEKHWVTEIVNITSFISHLNDLKTKRGRFTYDRMVDMFSRAYSPRNVSNDFKGLKRRYEFVKFNLDDAIENIQNIFDNMWSKLADDEFDFDEFFDEIEKHKAI